MELSIYGSYNHRSVGDKAILISLLDLLFRKDRPPIKVNVLAADAPAIRQELAEYEWASSVKIYQVFGGGSGKTEKVLSSGVGFRDLVPGSFKNLAKVIRNLSRRSKVPVGESDALILGGGNILMDLYPSWPSRLYTTVDAFHRKGRPVAAVGVGALPFQTVYRNLIRWACDKCSMIYVRDRRSKGALTKRWNIDSKVGPDLAFSFPLLESIPTKKQILGVNIANVFGVGWPVEDQERHEDYVCTVSHQVLSILKKYDDLAGVRIFNSNSPGDWPASDQLYEYLREAGISDDKILYERRTLTVSELVAQIGECSFAVTTRLHAAVLALMAGVPVVPIQYQPKVKTVLQTLNIEAPTISLEELDRISEAFQGVYEDRDEYVLTEAKRNNLDERNEYVIGSIIDNIS